MTAVSACQNAPDWLDALVGRHRCDRLTGARTDAKIIRWFQSTRQCGCKLEQTRDTDIRDSTQCDQGPILAFSRAGQHRPQHFPARRVWLFNLSQHAQHPRTDIA